MCTRVLYNNDNNANGHRPASCPDIPPTHRSFLSSPVSIMQWRLRIELLELRLIGGHRQYRSLVMMVIIIMDDMERCKPLAEKQQQQQNTETEIQFKH